MPARPIVVVGAGIIGLTTAVRILQSEAVQRSGAKVHVIADHLPNDPLDARYASTIAGAHHLSFADDNDVRQSTWDKKTFKVMYDEWRAEGEVTGLMLLKQTEYYVGTDSHLKIYESHPNFEVKDVSRSELSFPADHSIAFTSLTMTPRVYLNRLLEQIDALGGRIHRLQIPSLDYLSSPAVQSLIGPYPPSSVVLCVGIGALTLKGIEDKTVYPTRGQVVKVKAPWIRDGFTRQIGDLEGGEGGQRTYIIPRPDGEVILGGTRDEGDWYPYPRPDTTEDILKRALEICPGLKPANQSANSLSTDLISQTTLPPRQGWPLSGIVIDQLVGFRPSRRDGVRLEYGPDLNLGSKPTTVVYNYGHGGAGWQSCWGTADDAAELVLKAGERGPRARL